MTTIKTTCEHCGDVELLPTDLSLELDPGRDSGTYRFLCPACGFTQRRPANARVVSILLATGVVYEVKPSLEMAITEREIVAFRSALDRDDWLNELLPF